MMHVTQTVKPKPLFDLNPSELESLKGQGTRRKYAKGDYLWNEGDAADSVYLVEKGRVNMSIQTAEGASALVHFCTSAQSFCPAAAVSGKEYPCAAQASGEVTAVSVPRSSFLKLFNQLPSLAKNLLQQMAPMMCESHCRQALAASPVKTRLADLLSRLHGKYQGRDLPFTRQELANMSGTTVETTIRTLSEWEKLGVIQSSRGSIHVSQLAVLEEAMA
jgi:CRP-like cAMP-binding protein